MPGSRWFRLVIVPLLLLALAPAAVAGQSSPSGQQAVEQGVWKGATSDGGYVKFIVAKTQSGSYIVTDQVYEVTLTCSASGEQFPAIFAFFGFKQPLKDGSFKLRLFDPFERLLLAGTLNEDTGSGTVLGAFPLFASDGGLEVCGSGFQSWTAGAPPTSTSTGAAHPLRVNITRDENGRISVSRTGG
jgi:hypothetical protein